MLYCIVPMNSLSREWAVAVVNYVSLVIIIFCCIVPNRRMKYRWGRGCCKVAKLQGRSCCMIGKVIAVLSVVRITSNTQSRAVAKLQGWTQGAVAAM